jgi:hypothetical protein
MLVHNRDAGGLGVVRRMEDHRVAVDLNMAAGRRMHTGQQFHAGALASAIFAEQCQHLPERTEGGVLEAIVPLKAFVA